MKKQEEEGGDAAKHSSRADNGSHFGKIKTVVGLRGCKNNCAVEPKTTHTHYRKAVATVLLYKSKT
jgi:hypothetical protein